MKLLLVNPPSGKPWNGLTIYSQPLGGSEAAAAYMARDLVRLGHSVTVVSHGEPGVFDGVVYVQQPNVVIQDQWDVVIVSRAAEALEWPWQTNLKVFWIHDMPTPGTRIAADVVYCISKFQKEAWHLPDDFSFITHNGYDPSIFFPARGFRNENKLIWASNPDRGLPLAARIFQNIRQRWPELELHVYGRSAVYGWGSAQEEPFLPQEQYMENVFLHDPLPRNRLAAELRDAWALFYPTWWPETFCITALEAMACGTPVVTAPVGALSETAASQILTYDYLNAISQLRNLSRWKKLSAQGREYAINKTWGDAAIQWTDDFQRRLSVRMDGSGSAPSVSTQVGA